MKSLSAIVALWLVLSTSAFAAAKKGATDGTTEASARTSHKLGLGLSIGEPSPTIIGINAGYNITDYLRVTAGYGELTVTSSIEISDSGIVANEASAKTFGLGIRGMVPGWNLTPTAGLHFAHVSYLGKGLTVGGFEESGSHVYGSLGFDWQTSVGFNLGGGYNYSFKSGIGGSLFVNAGWFVDWLG